MKGSTDLQKTIIRGLQGLPESSLLDIAEYIFFVRQKALYPNNFQMQFEEAMLKEELSALEASEAAHLEDEFKDYKTNYPKK